jgi:hypothetical protein
MPRSASPRTREPSSKKRLNDEDYVLSQKGAGGGRLKKKRASIRPETQLVTASELTDDLDAPYGVRKGALSPSNQPPRRLATPVITSSPPTFEQDTLEPPPRHRERTKDFDTPSDYRSLTPEAPPSFLYSIYWRIIEKKERIVGRTFAEVDSNNVEQSYGDFKVFFNDWKERNIGYTVVRTELIGSYGGLRNDLSAFDELTSSAFQRILKQLAV